MRKLLYPGMLLALLVGAAGAAPPEISPEAMLAHIKFLASDELRGRANGTEGLERAGDYIAKQFEDAGLRPGGTDGNWFQPFELVAGLSVGGRNEVIVEVRGSRPVRLQLGSSYYPLAVTPNDAIASPSTSLQNIPLVFAGYGIAAPTMKYDDYAGIDVTGKAVLIFSHEPQENRHDSRLNGTRPIRETTLYAKALAARTRGARALLVV